MATQLRTSFGIVFWLGAVAAYGGTHLPHSQLLRVQRLIQNRPRTAIENGSAINDLARALAYVQLAEQDQHQLSDADIASLRFVDVSGAIVAACPSKAQTEIHWCKALMDPSFRGHRITIDAAWRRLARAKRTGEPHRAAAVELKTAVARLVRDFNDCHPRAIRVATPRAYRDYRQGKNACDQLLKLVNGATRLDAVRGPYGFCHGTIGDLVSHLNRHGLRLAAATPSGISTYHRIFSRLVVLCQRHLNIEQEIASAASLDSRNSFSERSALVRQRAVAKSLLRKRRLGRLSYQQYLAAMYPPSFSRATGNGGSSGGGYSSGSTSSPSSSTSGSYRTYSYTTTTYSTR